MQPIGLRDKTTKSDKESWDSNRETHKKGE